MWTDPQLAPPLEYCQVCGCEIYGPTGCARCRRRGNTGTGRGEVFG